MTLFGVDLSTRASSWTKAINLGKVYAITRLVGENGKVDPAYASNAATAAQAGLIHGAYHFTARDTVKEHCKRFVDTMGDPMGKLVMVDFENPNEHPTPTAADVADWFEEYRSHVPTHPVIVYSRSNFWHEVLGNPKLTDPNVVVMTSAYPGGTAYPGDNGGNWKDRYHGLAPAFWQYCGTTSIGIGAGVDLSAFKGTMDDLRRLTGEETVKPAQITDETPKLVTTAANSTWFDLDGTTVVLANRPALTERISPYGVGAKRAIFANVPDAAHRRVVLVTPATVSPAIPGASAALVKDAVNQALDHVAGATISVAQAIAAERIP